MIETILFAAFALVAILSALLVITSPSPIASALYLVGTLLSLAGLYVLLAAPFVAAIQIIVYAGAVIVLILFVIMLLNLRSIEERIAIGWKSAGVVIATLILIATFLSIMSGVASVIAAGELPDDFGRVATISGILFTKYIYAFEVTSVLLLLAILGAVALIRKTDGGEGHAD
jgi:NADH-quinone oxidoreductase subunit J